MYIKRHRITLLILLILCLFLSFFGVVISFISIMTRTGKSGLFEDILITFANIFMVAIAVFTSINTITSFKKGSVFMKELTLDPRKNGKRKAIIIFSIIAFIGLGSLITFALMYGNIIKSAFPRALDAAMLSFSSMIFVMGLSFSTYPYMVKKDLSKESI